MAIDPRRLRPSELCRLLNSTPLGEVVTERQLRRLREKAGYRIGDGRHVDLFRYTAWLAELRHAPKEETGGGYEAIKEAARARNAALSLAGRDIGELPAVVDADRKARCARDFRLFCESYFPLTFHLAWSSDHLKVIGRIEQAVLKGGLFAMAMPRGSGKTTIAECACLWALLYGHRDFVALIGSDEGHAADMLESIKTELDANDLLLEDFPEVCFPIQALEGIANRCAGQLYQGERTHIGWTAKEIVLPTIAGSRASGGIVKVAGITGRIRGMKHKRADGQTVRPSLVVLDDPQTDESARSLSQCATRESILAGAVLGLAGPGRKISGIMPCTVIRPGDMADSILDRDQHPDWNGERTRMVYSFPADEKLWGKYAELRAEGLRAGDGGKAATEFYRAHREAMDTGAVIAWPQRYNHDELSAVQHAMNLRLQDEAAFFAEYQNEPVETRVADVELLTADQIAARTSGLPRSALPLRCEHVTAMVDVHDNVLFWCVAAWSADFTGSVIDYGTFPQQGVRYFTQRRAPRSLAQLYPTAGREGAVLQGLEALTGELFSREWERADGAALRLSRCLIDSGYLAEQVKACCRTSPFAALLMPSRGLGIGAKNRPLAEFHRKPGDRLGHRWIVFGASRADPVRRVHFDANYWKCFLHRRLLVSPGDAGSLTLFGSSPEEHRLFSEHLSAEEPVRVAAQGRTVDEWRVKGSADNHWFDAAVGCAVAASMLGAVLRDAVGSVPAPPRKRRRHVAYL